ncbi:lipopolysaccharide biosynthesis protein [Prevotella sp. RM4]|uniref:lipopolysaccharide biosynthesis protein n=1 Tax=Prevotella sp. RM4 TaxID=1200547 RepID=UPI00051AC4B1|nr:lipopolysaccharide biosynthesis protein [Prevotella sp. RM4]
MAESVRSQLLHGVAWNFIEKVLIRGASFFIGIILARLLSPSDYGLMGMLSVFISISSVFIEGGLAKALIQRQNCQDIDYSTAFVANVGMSIGIYWIMFAAAPWIAIFYGEPILVDLTRILSLNFILGSFNIVQRAKLMAKVDFKSLAQINVISTIISGFIGVFMAYYGCGVWALVGQSLCSTLVLIVLFPVYSKWKPSFTFSKKSFCYLFGFGSKLMVTGVYSVVLNNISTICIGKYYRSQQLGFFTRASQFSELISTTSYDVIGNVTFPVLSELQNDVTKLVSVYRKSLFFTAMVIFPIMVLIALLAKPIVIILLTEKWLPCVALMQWLCLARMFTPLSAINMNLLNAVGRSDLFMKLDFSKLPLILVTFAITIPIGVEAIVIGDFVSTFICFFINAYLPGRMFGYGAWGQIKDWRYIFLSLCIMVLSVSTFLHFVTNVWLQLFGGGIIGIIVYMVCCLCFKIVDDDVLKILKIIE